MRKANRRQVLSGIGIAAFGNSITTGAAAEEKTSNPTSMVRLRGNFKNPVSAAQIENAKEKVLNSAPEIETGELHGRRGPIELENHEKILAYNFDVFDGAPTEYIGVHTSAGKPKKESAVDTSPENSGNKQQEPSGGKNIRDELPTKHHSKADKIIENRKAKSSTVSTSEVSSTSSEEKFDDWTKMAKNRHSKTDNEGNEMGMTVEWRRNPSNSSDHGLKSEIRMYDADDDAYGNYENHKARSDLSFNKSLVTVDSHEPGNTVGTSSSSFSVGYSGGNLEFGFSGGTTSSNLDIDDDSNIDSDMLVAHDYTISGDLRNNSLFLNAAATADVTEKSGEDFANIDLSTTFQNYKVAYGENFYSNLTNSYRYLWS